jgi:exonuclease III
MMANKNMQNIAKDCTIHRETRGTEKPSDHVPVEMIIEI